MMKSIIASYYHDIESIQRVSDDIKEQWHDEIGRDYLTNVVNPSLKQCYEHNRVMESVEAIVSEHEASILNIV